MARKASPPVDVRRSTRRRRTVSAYRDGERVVVLIPDMFTRAEEAEWVDRMLGKLTARDKRAGKGGDAALMSRAVGLALRYYPDFPGAASPVSVRWVDNQTSRWGSCTPDDKTIRLSSRLATMPGWVIDYVLLHELAHLIVPRHGKEFWRLVERYPRTERARGYLEGVADVADAPAA
ncbi:MAG: M48 metallopeptidase family protein [Stackebrandtia sp.]